MKPVTLTNPFANTILVRLARLFTLPSVPRRGQRGFSSARSRHWLAWHSSFLIFRGCSKDLRFRARWQRGCRKGLLQGIRDLVEFKNHRVNLWILGRFIRLTCMRDNILTSFLWVITAAGIRWCCRRLPILRGCGVQCYRGLATPLFELTLDPFL